MGNWLETAGSWLSTPFRAVLAPWWQRLVEEKAESAAVKNKVLEAVVRFRGTDFGRIVKLDQHAAEGIAHRVVELIKPLIENANGSTTSRETLRRIESEIEIQALPLGDWMELACLASVGEFNPRQALAVNFIDDQGSQSHASTVIFSLQSKFPFTQLLAVSSHDRARVSPDAIKSLATYCSRTTLPEARFELVEHVAPSIAFDPTLTKPRTISRGWKPTE